MRPCAVIYPLINFRFVRSSFLLLFVCFVFFSSVLLFFHVIYCLQLATVNKVLLGNIPTWVCVCVFICLLRRDLFPRVLQTYK